MKDKHKVSWSRVFKSQAYDMPTFKHKELPIYVTKEFDFYRCVEFKKDFYGMTAGQLFKGNLRMCTGRYASLFPNQKISYWADSPKTARAEIKKHGSGCDILTFWAYDDASSFIPCLGNNEMLYIVDGRRSGIQLLIEKADSGIDLTIEEQTMMERILKEPIDCIAYESKAYPGGENFIFLERGFKKLFMRQLRLRFGRKNGGSHDYICCATSSDYTPHPKSYGEFFLPKCRIRMDDNYLKTEEYMTRIKNMEDVYDSKFGRSRKREKKN